MCVLTAVYSQGKQRPTTSHGPVWELDNPLPQSQPRQRKSFASVRCGHYLNLTSQYSCLSSWMAPEPFWSLTVYFYDSSSLLMVYFEKFQNYKRWNYLGPTYPPTYHQLRPFCLIYFLSLAPREPSEERQEVDFWLAATLPSWPAKKACIAIDVLTETSTSS